MKSSFMIIDIAKLKPHEELDEKLLKDFLEQLKNDGHMKKPILVEDRHYIILDGHHRVEGLKILGYSKVPAHVVDYFDEDIVVSVWPGAIVDKVRKEDVLERGLKGDLYPPKTTRHILKYELKDVRIDLSELV